MTAGGKTGHLMVRQAHHEEESRALILSLSKDEPFLGSRRFRDLMVRQAHHEDDVGMTGDRDPG